ncbi:MAG TPA: hypothetical protein VK327_00440 [Candidatus Paceibacterota bacterium]|nr:hypothetical protein [Candidatus Paceibacterota bacterium]
MQASISDQFLSGASEIALSNRTRSKEKAASNIIGRLTSNLQVAGGSVSDRLADRELQVFELTGTGLSTWEIPERLRINVMAQSKRTERGSQINLLFGTQANSCNL